MEVKDVPINLERVEIRNHHERHAGDIVKL